MDEHPVDHYGKRIIAVVVGLVLGLIVGVVGGIVVVGFGDPLIVTIAAVTIGMVALAWFVPAPFLFVAEVVLSIFS